MNNELNNNIGSPILFYVWGDREQGSKLNQDRYEVFVDGEYVGDKVLYAQNEDESSVADFLEKQGYDQVKVEKDGDHIIVHSHDHDEAAKMRHALEVYLNNR